MALVSCDFAMRVTRLLKNLTIMSKIVKLKKGDG